MTQVDSFFGQHGSDKAQVRRLPGPDDPTFHLATILGMMAGDRYAPPLEQQGDTYTADDLFADSATESPQGQPSTNKKLGGVLGAAQKYMGVKYVYGGNDPKNGLDCSSFVQRAFADVGVMLPRVTYDQVKEGVEVQRQDLQPGDLIFFWGDGNRRNGHVGIYAGGDVMLDEPHTGSSVGYHTINWKQVTAFRRVG